MVSRDPFLHCLHADGATFFTLTFPAPHASLSRRFDHKGLVELSSAAGYQWMRAYLFVDDQPYYCRADGDGTFALVDVPAGTYQLVCWLPSWLELRHDRDPETAIITRLFFRPPTERSRGVIVVPGASVEADFEFSDHDFLP
jgi:hypothetical protein